MLSSLGNPSYNLYFCNPLCLCQNQGSVAPTVHMKPRLSHYIISGETSVKSDMSLLSVMGKLSVCCPPKESSSLQSVSALTCYASSPFTLQLQERWWWQRRTVYLHLFNLRNTITQTYPYPSISNFRMQDSVCLRRETSETIPISSRVSWCWPDLLWDILLSPTDFCTWAWRVLPTQRRKLLTVSKGTLDVILIGKWPTTNIQQ